MFFFFFFFFFKQKTAYEILSGLVGLEDIIEELVGDIQDEHEPHLPATMSYADGSFEFDGKVLVDEVAEIMDIEIDNSDSDTIGATSLVC